MMMMKWNVCWILGFGLFVGSSDCMVLFHEANRIHSSPTIHGEKIQQQQSKIDSAVTPSPRRAFLKTATASLLGGLIASCASPTEASAESNSGDDLIKVYFGCGCFWHVQHEFAMAEQRILGRRPEEFTARAGYAGGNNKNQKVCYHNALGIGDYGKLGHAEVVSLEIPSSKFYDFCVEYFQLFDNKGYRPDQWGDRGPEYRNLVGIQSSAGGVTFNDLRRQLVEASVATGDKLDFAMGRGNDADIPQTVFVMDINKHPFYMGEQYHQFHDGFRLDENYPNSYNNLASYFAKEQGQAFGSKCPNGFIGVGAGGL